MQSKSWINCCFYILHSELETRQSLKSAISQIFSKQIKIFHKITFVQDEKLILICQETKLVGTPCIKRKWLKNCSSILNFVLTCFTIIKMHITQWLKMAQKVSWNWTYETILDDFQTLWTQFLRNACLVEFQ